jgi:inner membrane transporter RhtA
VFALWRRPWRRWGSASRSERMTVAAWGAVLAVMNICFYVAIDRVPLGTVAAIEFVGPVLIAVMGISSRRNVVALLLAVAGVYVLTDVRLVGEPIGFAFAFANAGLFAAYVVLGHRVSRHASLGGIDGLAMAMLIATVVVTPVGGPQVLNVMRDPIAVLAGVGVGICSSVIPYVCDQLAMGRMSRATYSLLVSLLPATATVIGALVLAQVPTVIEVLGVALVIAAVAVHHDPGTAPAAGRAQAVPGASAVNDRACGEPAAAARCRRPIGRHRGRRL